MENETDENAFDSVFSEKVEEQETAATTADTETDDNDTEPTEETVEATSDDSEAGNSDDSTDDVDSEAKQVPMASYMAEKKKRQAEAAEKQRLTEELAEARGKLSVLEKTDSEPEVEEDVDFFTDPDAALAKMNLRIKQAEERADAASAKALARVSDAQARRNHPDYEDKMAKYAELKASNPTIAKAVAESDDPAETAYQAVLDSEAMADPVAFREQMKAELLAELRAEGVTSDKKTAVKDAPTNLANARSIDDEASESESVEGLDFEAIFT